jgi:hypothetical protein
MTRSVQINDGGIIGIQDGRGFENPQNSGGLELNELPS